MKVSGRYAKPIVVGLIAVSSFFIERNSMKNKLLKKLVYSALCLALCMVLPFLTGQIPEIGVALSPMHIPVLLCGFICGGPFGAIVGFVAPFLRFALFGMPPVFPTGLAMAFELAAYGLSAGLLNKTFPKKMPYIYLSLALSMLIGRIVWGIVMYIIMLSTGGEFTLMMFLGGAFIKAFPGIICHILIIPPIVFALRKARLTLNDNT